MEYVPVPPPLVLDPLPLPEPLPEELEKDDPLDLPDPLPDELDDPDVEPEPVPEPDPGPDADALAPDDCAVASATPLVWFSAGRSLWVHTPSAEYTFVPGTWMATVRVGASTFTTDSTSSSASRSPIR